MTQSSTCNFHMFVSSTLENMNSSTWRRVKNGVPSPPAPGITQWGLPLPWTACHTWSTGSLCGPSGVACGGAACQGGRRLCRTLYTGRSSLSGSCGRASSPAVAESKQNSFRREKYVVKQSRELLAWRKKVLTALWSSLVYKVLYRNSWYLGNCFHKAKTFVLRIWMDNLISSRLILEAIV